MNGKPEHKISASHRIEPYELSEIIKNGFYRSKGPDLWFDAGKAVLDSLGVELVLQSPTETKIVIKIHQP